MQLRQNMLDIASLYASETGMKISAVAAVAARDAGFFGRMARGSASFTARKYDDVMRWFSVNWPIGTTWPTKIPRPTSSEAEAA